MKGPMKWNKIFKFGDTLKSEGNYTKQIMVARKSWTMEVDVVKSDIPLLMSKDMTKDMRMIIVLEEDTVSVEGKKIKLRTTRSGIYILPLEKDEGRIKKESAHEA